MLAKFFTNIRYFFELILVKICLSIFSILGIRCASNLGSFIAKLIGKRISVNQLARDNISKSFPKLNNQKISKILDDMWDNLGRIVGEYIHISKLAKENIGDLVSADDDTLKNIKYIKENYNGGIIFSAHIGNWEVGPKFFLKHGINVKTVYRPLNNVAVDKITSQVRNVGLIPKTSKGSKQIIREIKEGNYIIILVDQKTTEGIEVPFFGRDALTSSSIARLALKYNIPLIPTRIIRIGKESKFKIEISKALEIKKSKVDDDKKLFDIMKKVNEKLESWIEEYPSQWFWVHNRWKK